ncbi:ADP-heptose--LPS heptosyltransferase II [mine drainage metagenome]|uniref:lipopolysaccharide heptosyltransferase II n=1 Tax=mine drainage metagenome TaxID=410659 RepID=T1A8N1_9ZZZZ
MDRAYELDIPHGQIGLLRRWRLAKELHAQDYRQAIILPRSWKSALLPFLAGIPKRTGFLGEMRYGLLNDIRPNPTRHEVPFRKQLLSLGLAPGEPLPQLTPEPHIRVDPEARSRTLKRLGLDQRLDQTIIALLPGAEYGPAKRWPIESFSGLAKIIREWRHAVWILGSARDQVMGAAIASAAPGAVNLCGQTTLPEAADLLSVTSLAVTNDSGLMHLAAGVGIRLVCLYGSSSIDYTPPGSRQALILSLHLDCSPCFARECPLGHLNCLRNLSVASVAEAVEKQLSV